MVTTAAASAALSIDRAVASGSSSTAISRRQLLGPSVRDSSTLLVASHLSRNEQSAAQCAACAESEMFATSSSAALRQPPLGAGSVSTVGIPHCRQAVVCKARARRGGRFILYESPDAYVLLRPGKEETFVNRDELYKELSILLHNWPDPQLPDDLARFNDIDKAVTFLIKNACELCLGGGLGTVQWYEVRLK